MRTHGVLSLAAALIVLSASAFARDGVNVGRKSIFTKLVSAERVENSSALQYEQMTRQAFQKRALLAEDHPKVARVRRIFDDLYPHTFKFNERAKTWRWEINVLESPSINAFCMPGGKIAIFTGIIDKLALTDDELAMIMGHEMGHALWEHARERTAKTNLTSIGSRIVGALLFGQAGELIGAAGSSLAALKFSRNDETEADLIGLELAARAGFDPRAGITLWEKMSKAARGAPPAWFSTHPSSASRIKKIEAALPDVTPLYDAARRDKKS